VVIRRRGGIGCFGGEVVKNGRGGDCHRRLPTAVPRIIEPLLAPWSGPKF
jgi:hypothetical protein